MKTATTSSPKITTLSAPWYALQRKLAYTIGQSATIMVSELSANDYKIEITALNENIAKALANTLKLEHELGNITVIINILDSKGNMWVPNNNANNSSFLIENLQTALTNNPLVYNVEEFNSQATICCMPQVVQFYNDDISNPYEFTSMIAAQAFREVFKPEITAYTLGRKIGNI